jgi:phosphoglycerate kinase
VPLDEKGNILDDFKIKQALPTIKYLIDQKAKIILMSHLGNPGGKVVPELKLDKIAEKLSEYLGFPIAKTDDCVGPEIESHAGGLEACQVLLLENLRFHKEETEGDLKFAEQLSWMCEVYINDDFADCGKICASITGVPQYLSSGAGLLLEKEINNLNKILQSEKPFAVIVGGNPEEETLKFIDKISETADWILVSGLIKDELIKKEMLFKHQDKIISPVGFAESLDIDEKTIKIFQEKIMPAKTIFWYGSLGKIEEERYANGTLKIAEIITETKAFSVVCGEKLVEFLVREKLAAKFSHVSLGGKTALQILSKEKLPGLVALE